MKKKYKILVDDRSTRENLFPHAGYMDFFNVFSSGRRIQILLFAFNQIIITSPKRFEHLSALTPERFGRAILSREYIILHIYLYL